MRWVLWLAVSACTATVSLSSLAQSLPAGTASGPTFAQVVDAAWQRSAAGQSAQARRNQQRAAQDAAGSLTPAPPSVALSQRSDRLNRNLGVRETEVELALPLWLPGTRAAALALAGAESEAAESQLQLSRLKLAGELREAIWSVRIAHNEVDASTRRVAEAQALAADVQRRISAGDLARTNANQAQGLVQLSSASQAEARGRLLRAERFYVALTGVAVLPLQAEVPTLAPALETHPQVVNAERASAAARARLEHASRVTRDPPELTLGIRSERATFGESNVTSARIGLRMPFGTDARNQPRITAASAELVEIEAGARLERDRLQAEIDAAAAELEQARRIELLAAERAWLAADTQQLLAKAFRLGEIDLPTRLRTENERFDAELALGRARLEAGRAISRLQQAYGLLP